MAVTEVTIIREEYAQEGNKYNAVRVYQVKVSDINDDVIDALYADDGTTAVDDVGDTWGATKAKSKSATAFNEDQLTYEVTVEYSSEVDPGWVFPENPLSMPNQYSYSGENITEPYFRDVAGDPVVNSAGDDYAELPQRERNYRTITITRNAATYDDATASAYIERINSGSVSINAVSYAARKLRISNYDATGPHEQNGVEYWTETIVVKVRPEGWDDKLEDRGLNELASGKLKPILDAKHEAIVAPYPLDGMGGAKANPTDTPAQRTHKPYTAGSFPSGL